MPWCNRLYLIRKSIPLPYRTTNRSSASHLRSASDIDHHVQCLSLSTSRLYVLLTRNHEQYADIGKAGWARDATSVECADEMRLTKHNSCAQVYSMRFMLTKQ